MDVFKILGALGGIGGLLSIYLNYIISRRTSDEKFIDRLRQISSEVQSDKPNKWWTVQAFDSIYGINISFEIIKTLIESNVRSKSIMIVSRLARNHIAYEPHSMNRHFVSLSWRDPNAVRRKLAYRWGTIFVLIISALYLITLKEKGWLGIVYGTLGLLSELACLIILKTTLDAYQRIWLVYQYQNFGKLHNW